MIWILWPVRGTGICIIYRTHKKNAYRDSSYEQIGALSGFLVPLLYLKQKKYAELHQWSTAIIGGLTGFSVAAHIGITVRVLFQRDVR